MATNPRFSGISAVVTGSSSGIGRATAVALAKAGASKLVVHYCSNQRGAEDTAALAKQFGCNEVLVVEADLRDSSQRQNLARAAFKEFGKVDTWINNAGADVLTGEVANLPFAEKLERLWQVDVQATIDLSRDVAKRMSDQPQDHPESPPPSMTFIGWDQAPQGMEGDAGQMFGPIKAAVMAFANSMSQEFSPRIRVNTVAPGWIQTSWGETTNQYWDDRAKGTSVNATLGNTRRRRQSHSVRRRSSQHIHHRSNHRSQRRLEPKVYLGRFDCRP